MSRSHRFATEAPTFDLLQRALAGETERISIKEIVLMRRIHNPKAPRVMEFRHRWSSVDGQAWTTVKKVARTEARRIAQERGLDVIIVDCTGDPIERISRDG